MSNEKTFGDADRYEIVTVNDFLGVPEDRMADCLAAFAEAIHTVRYTIKILQAIAEDQGHVLPDGFARMPSFTWVDDGLGNQRVHFEESVT